jgi:DNA-nicking Smr family endonuclease
MNDLSKAIDLLIERMNLLNIHISNISKELKGESKQNFEDNLIDEDDEDDCFFLLDENKKKHNKNNLKKTAPFNYEESLKKLISYNVEHDYLLENNKSYNLKKAEDERKIRKYSNNIALDFLGKIQYKQKIDLHGKKLVESKTFLQQKLKEAEEFVRENKNKVIILLLIITGRGKHSPGNKPVLRPNILKWLKDNNYNVIEEYSGAIKVLIQ